MRLETERINPRLYTSTFIIMASANFCIACSFSIFFLFPLFITGHGGTKADIGILMGVMAIASVLCRPWISQMVDRIGRKRSYTIGCLTMSLLPFCYLLFKGDLSDFFLPLIPVRMMHGVGLAICFTSGFTFIADIVPEERLNEGIGMYGTSALLGMAIGPGAAEIIIRECGFNMFFLTAAGLSALGLAIISPLAESYVPVSRDSGRSFLSVLADRKILGVTLIALLFGVGLAAYGGFVTPFGQELGLPFISLYFLAYSAAAALTRFFGGRLADKVGEERIVPYALSLTGGGLLLLIFLNGTALLVLSGLITGCGHGLLFPSLNALAIRDEPIDIRGKINGIFTGGIDAGVFFGSVILGYIGEWAGFRALFLAAGLALLIGLTMYRLEIFSDR